jgi:hypothetical protein
VFDARRSIDGACASLHLLRQNLLKMTLRRSNTPVPSPLKCSRDLTRGGTRIRRSRYRSNDCNTVRARVADRFDVCRIDATDRYQAEAVSGLRGFSKRGQSQRGAETHLLRGFEYGTEMDVIDRCAKALDLFGRVHGRA